jgi:hypothetical protein
MIAGATVRRLNPVSHGDTKMKKVIAVLPLVAFLAAIACSDVTTPQADQFGASFNQGVSAHCPATGEAWTKIDSGSGSESGAFGSFDWNGATLNYNLNAGWQLEFCLKYSTLTDYETVSGSGSIVTGTGQDISYMSWRVIEMGGVAFQGCSPGFWRNHLNDWVGLNTNDTYALGGEFTGTYLQAITARGGGANAYARAATAAQLNINHGGIEFEAPSLDGYTAAQLDAMNNAGCPLDGSDNTTAGGKK